MRDSKGNDVKIGDAVRVVPTRENGHREAVGWINKFSSNMGSEHAMVNDCNCGRPVTVCNDWTWSSWLKSSEFTKIGGPQ